MKEFNCLAFVLVFLSCVAKNQPAASYFSPDYIFLQQDIQLMELDPLGNIYLVDGSDRLLKFDTAGQLLFTVVNNNLGRVHNLDVGNPFKILAFYRDQQTLLLYDRTLSEIQRIPLILWGLQDVTAACLSPDNAIWVFNGMNKVLMKMSDKGDPIVTSDPFDIIRPASSRPDFIYDVDHLLLLKEESKPLSLFNDFGNHLRSLEIDDEVFSVSNDVLIINKGSFILLRRIQDGEEIISYPLQDNMVDKRIHFSAHHFYGMDDKGVFIVPVKR